MNDQLTHEGQSRKALPFCAFYEGRIIILYNYSKFKSKMQAPVLNDIKKAKGTDVVPFALFFFAYESSSPTDISNGKALVPVHKELIRTNPLRQIFF